MTAQGPHPQDSTRALPDTDAQALSARAEAGESSELKAVWKALQLPDPPWPMEHPPKLLYRQVDPQAGELQIAGLWSQAG